MAMEDNKVIQNKVEEDNWVRPEYLPMPEFIPTDLSTINFDFSYLKESLIEYLTILNQRPRYHGIFRYMNDDE
jgi:hypothetical protein